MSIIQIIDTFTFYGIDVLLLAAATAVFVQILKISVFRKLKKKLLTFLPFVCGTLFYSAYAAIRELSLFYVLENYVLILEHGISVGAAATLIYVLYEQFVRDKKGISVAESVVKTLIEGYVPTEKTKTVARLIAEAIEKDVTGNGAKRAAEIIAENSEEQINERDIALLSKLIIETLAHLAAN